MKQGIAIYSLYFLIFLLICFLTLQADDELAMKEVREEWCKRYRDETGENLPDLELSDRIYNFCACSSLSVG